MAIRAAELEIVIGADTNPAVQGIRGAMRAISNAASTALGVFSGMLMTQAVGALSGLASAGVQAVGEFERLELTLQTLVRRDLARAGQSLEEVGQRTQELIDWVQQLARESPFDASGVTVALRTAMAYGFTTEQAQRLTTAVIDFAAGSGQSADVMNQVALALGQIQAKGRLAGQEMLQLVNAGIDVRDALSRYLGKPVEEIARMMERGMIDANTAIEAVLQTLETDFGGAAREQAHTVSGLLSTFEELKKLGLRELFEGIVEAIRPLAISFLDWLQGPGLERLHEIGTNLGDLVGRLVSLAAAFSESGAFSEEFSAALGNISPKLQEIWDYLSPFIQQGLTWITEHAEEVKAALIGMAVAAGALAVIGSIVSMINPVTLALTAIVAAVGLLSAAWAGNWGGIRDKVTEVWAWLQPIFQNIREWLEQNIPVALSTVQQIWQTVWTAVTAVFRAIWPIIQAVWDAFKAAFSGDWYSFGENLRLAWDRLWNLVGEILRNAVSFIRERIADLIQSIITFFTDTDWGEVGHNIVQGIAEGLSNAANWLIETARDVGQAVYDAVCGFFGIHSPSRLFEEVGKNLVLGWISGVESMLPDLKRSMQSLGIPYASSMQFAENRPSAGGLQIGNVNITFRDTTLTPGTLSRALQQLEWTYL
ncbi:MAG: tape measure protein [Anaerolineales bacterium]